MDCLKKCAYCGKERPVAEMKRGTVIFQNIRFVAGNPKRFIDKKENWYCAYGPCHGYDQMAHEG